jgi:integrase
MFIGGVVMGSLFKRKDSQYWWCAIKSGGKWMSLSTKETNKNKARDFMIRKEGDASKGFNVHAYDKTTFEDLKEAILRSYREKGNRTLDKVEQNFKHLEPFFDDIPVVAINQSVIAKYKEHILKTTKLSKTSINRHLATLRNGLNLLYADDMIPRVPKIRMYKEDNARQLALTWGEVQKLVAAAKKHRPYLAPIIQTAVQTGLRRGAILSMEWKHIDFHAGVIRLPSLLLKNKEPWIYEYHADPIMKEVIDHQWQNRKDFCPWVFPERNGKDRLYDFRKSWATCVDKAGIRPGRKVIFHDLRRTAISLLSKTGSTDGEMMNLMGIKSPQTLHRYDIVDSRRRIHVLRRRQESLDEQTDNVVALKKKATGKEKEPREFDEAEAEAKAFRKSG